MSLLNRTNRGDVYAGETTLEVLCCPSCGVLYAAPEKMVNECRRLGSGHYVICPNGHEVHWPGKTEAERLREQLERERERAGRLAAQRDQAQASARANRGAATRARNQRDRDRRRVAAGVCPCCNRTFKNLGRHMASQHPDFGPLGEHDHGETA